MTAQRKQAADKRSRPSIQKGASPTVYISETGAVKAPRVRAAADAKQTTPPTRQYLSQGVGDACRSPLFHGVTRATRSSEYVGGVSDFLAHPFAVEFAGVRERSKAKRLHAHLKRHVEIRHDFLGKLRDVLLEAVGRVKVYGTNGVELVENASVHLHHAGRRFSGSEDDNGAETHALNVVPSLHASIGGYIHSMSNVRAIRLRGSARRGVGGLLLIDAVASTYLLCRGVEKHNVMGQLGVLALVSLAAGVIFGLRARLVPIWLAPVITWGVAVVPVLVTEVLVRGFVHGVVNAAVTMSLGWIVIGLTQSVCLAVTAIPLTLLRQRRQNDEVTILRPGEWR